MQQEKITVRDFCRNDWNRIVEIYNSTVSSRLVTADTEPVTVESRTRWFNEHSAEHRPLWVLEDENKFMLGWVSFQSFYGRPAYNATVEISIYLDPSARGRGIGKWVLNYSLERAPGFGVKTVLGFIFDHNEPSIRLFQSAGFESWAHLPKIAVLDGIDRGVRIMGKRIA